MSPQPPYSHRLRVAHLNPHQPTVLDLTPNAAARAAIAGALGLRDLPALHLRGEIRAEGEADWALTGEMRATAVQDSVVTLETVTTELRDDLHLRYSPHVRIPEGDEVEMGDADIEPLGPFIDAGAALVEALSLALPLYPRAPGAELPGAGDKPAPEDDRRKPFAGLGDLLARRDD